jgi:peptide/nickel transport system ATP-binding protein
MNAMLHKDTPARKRQAIVDVRGLVVDFTTRNTLLSKQTVRAVNDVSFQLFRGEALAVVGESGSGKSTCARTLCKLNVPTRGVVHFDQREIEQFQTPEERLQYAARMQMIFQDPFGSLNPVHKVKHHLMRPLRLHQPELSTSELKDRIENLLSQVGLTPVAETAEKYPHELSGGQRQRVAIARALAVGAEVILADEPISMLDVSIRLGILNLMEEMKQKQNIAFLYITHDIATARYFAERTAVMYVGHMVEWGESESVTQHPRHPYTQLLLDSVPDPRRKRTHRAQATKADVPLWTPKSQGCPFAERCPQVQSRCRQELPPIQQVGPGHFARCFDLKAVPVRQAP